MALAGAGTASASVLCHSTSTPCTEKWAKNTEVEFTLTPGSSGSWQTVEGTTINTCTQGEIKGSISNPGSENEAVRISIPKTGWVWQESKCTTRSETLEGGEIEILAIAGTDNGEVRLTGFNFTTIAFGVSCTYNFPKSTTYGTITASGSGDATIDVNTTLTKSGGGFTCPGSLKWIESFTETRPQETPLYVEPS
jgi:hypothetical protein